MEDEKAPRRASTPGLARGRLEPLCDSETAKGWMPSLLGAREAGVARSGAGTAGAEVGCSGHNY